MGRLDRLRQMQEQGIQAISAFYKERKNELRVKDTELAAFIVVQTSEALTHAIVNFHPAYLKDDRAINEITDLLVLYLVGYVFEHRPSKSLGSLALKVSNPQ